MLNTSPAAMMRNACATSRPGKKLDEAFRALMWRWFESKLIPVLDYYASGNQIIRLIADHTPPGFHSRIMGMQNIKGTGLDFVYRWQAWALCHEACSELRTPDATTYRRGLAALSRAAIELLKLTQQQKGGWLYDKLRIRMMMLVDSVQVFRRKLKDAKFRLR